MEYLFARHISWQLLLALAVWAVIWVEGCRVVLGRVRFSVLRAILFVWLALIFIAPTLPHWRRMAWLGSAGEVLLLVNFWVAAMVSVVGLWRLGILGLRRLGIPETLDPGRRRFCRDLGLGAFVVGGMAGPGVLWSTTKLDERRYGFDGATLGLTAGARLAFISDLHAGFFLNRSLLEECLARLKAGEPEVVVFGGDAVNRRHAEIEEVGWFFKELTARWPVVAVLGNHDQWNNPRAVTRDLTSWGVVVLRDGRWVAPSGLVLAGADDYRYQRGPRRCLLDEAVGARGRVVFVTHNPDTLARLSPSEWERAALVLAGHTHGGQIVPWPGKALVVQSNPHYLSGVIRDPDRPPVLVTRGLGYTGVPFRFNCDPELSWVDIS